MTRRRWLLPQTPDVIALLRQQLAVTIEGVDAFEAWAVGDAAAAERLWNTEQRGDATKRALLEALRAAFVTPLDPEDVFALSWNRLDPRPHAGSRRRSRGHGLSVR